MRSGPPCKVKAAGRDSFLSFCGTHLSATDLEAKDTTPSRAYEAVTADERWFAGRLPRGKADRLLENASNGTFLVRESDSRPVCYPTSSPDFATNRFLK
jgi:hypothetical protein